MLPGKQKQIIIVRAALEVQTYNNVCECVYMYPNYFLWTLLHSLQSAENEAFVGGNHRLVSLQRENLRFYADESEQVRNRWYLCVCVDRCSVPVDFELQYSGLLLITQRTLLLS